MPHHLANGAHRFFILAGMPRAGTTYLYHAFAAHPDAFVPFRKELRYFSLNYHRGKDWYERFFAQAAPKALCVDASPDYFMDVAAPGRLRDFAPEIKVALAVRDPAVWAVSLHRQLCTIESHVPKFRDFLAFGQYPDFALPMWRKNPTLQFSLQAGFIQSQLISFSQALGDRLLLYDFAWFERNPLQVLQALESFLGVTPFFSESNLPSGRINTRGRKNVRWLSYLFSRDILVNAAGSLLPRKLLVSSRMKADRASAANSHNALFATDAEDLALAQESLASEIAYVKSLFSESSLILGTGRPYPVAAI